METRLGTQAWSYPEWVGSFYEPGTTSGEYLRAYAREFGTVEVDTTFYGTPPPERLARWSSVVPEAFRFSLKLPRAITHDGALSVATRSEMRRFFDVARTLGDRLGCVLVQLPPEFARDRGNSLSVRDAVRAMPRDLAIAFEFRDPSWYDAALARFLADHGVALALLDTPFVDRERVVAAALDAALPFAYLRLLGVRGSVTRFDHVQIDRGEDLAWWAAALRGLPSSVERLFAYTSNFYAGHAPATARDLAIALGVPHEVPQRTEQITLF